MVKALVTGASGFLGGHLAERAVRAGDEVRALVRRNSDIAHLRILPGIETASGDLSDPDSLRSAAKGVDVVYHSAAHVTDFGPRAQFVETNARGTARLLEAAQEGGVSRFVFISSPSALMRRNEGDRFDIDESAPYPDRWLNHYSETKAAAEKLVLAANRPGFTTVALRPRGIWGPRDRSGFVPRLVARMADGRLPDLSGGRRVLASLCHCDNAVAASLLAGSALADVVGGRPYFVADAEKTDLWAFLARLADVFGGHPPTRRVPPPVRDAMAAAMDLAWRLPGLAARREPPLTRYSVAVLTRCATYSTAAAERDLGYVPVTDQETGLQRLREWVESIGGVREFVRSVR